MFIANLFKKNLAYFIPVIIFLLTGIVFLALFSKDVIQLTLNGWYNPFFDSFFKFVTHLGEGLFFGLVALILIFVRWRFFLGIIIAAVLTVMLTGFLKNVIFKGEPRPVKYFELKHELRLVKGVKMNTINSFPSGHTTSIFACMGFVALIVAKNWFKFLCFLTAASTGYSRIYLSQHFLKDVVAGAFIGTCIAILSYYIMLQLRFVWADSQVKFKKR